MPRSSTSLMILYFTLKSMIPFELIFAKSRRSVSTLILFTSRGLVVLAPFIEKKKKTFSPLHRLSVFIKGQSTISVWVCFFFMFQQFTRILLSIQCRLDYCGFTVNLKVGQCQSSNFVPVQISLGYS